MRAADERRGSAHTRGYDVRWRAYSRARLAEHPLCADPFGIHGPDGRLADLTDHVIPVWAGGDFWAPENHQSLCTRCNLRKAAEDRKRYRPKPPRAKNEAMHAEAQRWSRGSRPQTSDHPPSIEEPTT